MLVKQPSMIMNFLLKIIKNNIKLPNLSERKSMKVTVIAKLLPSDRKNLSNNNFLL